MQNHQNQKSSHSMQETIKDLHSHDYRKQSTKLQMHEYAKPQAVEGVHANAHGKQGAVDEMRMQSYNRQGAVDEMRMQSYNRQGAMEGLQPHEHGKPEVASEGQINGHSKMQPHEHGKPEVAGEGQINGHGKMQSREQGKPEVASEVPINVHGKRVTVDEMQINVHGKQGGAVELQMQGHSRQAIVSSVKAAFETYRCDTQHSMLRRCKGWNYSGPGMYMITIVLADRKSNALGHVVVDECVGDGIGAADAMQESNISGRSQGSSYTAKGRSTSLAANVQGTSTSAKGRVAGIPAKAHCELSAIGQVVAECWEAIPKFYPQVQIIAKQLMPDHFHGILWVKQPLGCHLGQVIKGFKIGCNRGASSVRGSSVLGDIIAEKGPQEGCAGKLGDGGHGGGGLLGDNIAEQRTPSIKIQPLFAEGFNDIILFREGQLAAMINYIRANPLRLAVKSARPDLFTVRRKSIISLGEAGKGRFMAIGNPFLIKRPMAQVQCSRQWLTYRRVPKPGGGRKLARDSRGAPIIEHSTAEYAERRDTLLVAAAHGIVLLSPCVSDGERQIAREALEAGFPLITMHNKGFSPLQKPSGRHFDACSAGKLLMLAPAGWPFVPGDKPMTRLDATAMNRLCQWIAGDGAAEINYHGMQPVNIDRLARTAALM